jgi:hypothetical protein
LLKVRSVVVGTKPGAVASQIHSNPSLLTVLYCTVAATGGKKNISQIAGRDLVEDEDGRVWRYSRDSYSCACLRSQVRTFDGPVLSQPAFEPPDVVQGNVENQPAALRMDGFSYVRKGIAQENNGLPPGGSH